MDFYFTTSASAFSEFTWVVKSIHVIGCFCVVDHFIDIIPGSFVCFMCIFSNLSDRSGPILLKNLLKEFATSVANKFIEGFRKFFYLPDYL